MNTTIQGTIHDPQKLTLANHQNSLRLHLYTCTLSQEQEQTQIAFDEQGRFKIELEPSEKAVQYRVKLFYQEEEAQTLIGESAKLCMGKTHEIDFYFDPKRFVVLLPHLQQQTEPLLEELSFEALSEEQLQQLACLCRQDIADVRALQLATKWHQELEAKTTEKWLEWEKIKGQDEDYFKKAAHHLENLLQESPHSFAFLFALAMEGETDWKKGLSASKNQLSKKIDAANAKKWVFIDQRAQRVLLEGLPPLRDALLLQAEYDDLFYDAKLLFLSSLLFNEKSSFLDAALEAGSVAEVLVEDSDFKTEFTNLATLGEQLDQFPPLLQKTVKDIASIGGLDFSKVYSWQQKKWKTQIRSLPAGKRFPDQYKASSTPLEDYAAAISQRLFAQNPTPILLSVLTASNVPNRNSIERILKEHPDFKIGKDTVYSYFTTREEGEGKVVISETEMADVKTFARVSKLLGDYTEAPLMDYLYEQREVEGSTDKEITVQLTSATAVYRYGKGKIINDIVELGYPEKVAEQIYCKAYTNYRTAVFLASQYQVYERADALIPQVLQVNGGTVTTPAVAGLVNMEDLFGSMDYCSCGHCQSVLSPAAYMTDLLHWLQADVVCPSGKTGYNPIKNRRPDIGFIQLSCKNTNTVMPYIDLVNEQLAINLQTAPDYRVLQTNWDTEQLLVEPEHEAVLATAYDMLKDVKYSLTLPYDAKWTHSRGYLEKLGTTQAELIQYFSNHNSPAYFNINWAKAYLGICDSEYKILNEQSADAAFWTDHLGLSASTKNLGALLSCLDISKDLFQEIYETEFVANTALLITANEDPACDWNLYEIDSTFARAVAHRFVRFLRLYQLLELSVAQLDRAIQNNGTGKIDESGLVEMAGFLHVSETQGLPLDTILNWLEGSSTRATELERHLGLSSGEITAYFNRFSSGSFPVTSEELHRFITKSSRIKGLGISLEGYLKLHRDESTFTSEAADVWDQIVAAVNSFPGTRDEHDDLKLFETGTNDLLIPEVKLELINVLVNKSQVEANIILALCPEHFELDLLHNIENGDTWAGVVATIFVPIYEYLKHIQLYKSVFNLTDETWVNIDRPTANRFWTKFDTYQNNQSVDNILWYDTVVQLQEALQIPYEVLLKEVSDASPGTLDNATFNLLYTNYPAEADHATVAAIYDFAKSMVVDSNNFADTLWHTNALMEYCAAVDINFVLLKSWVWDGANPTEIGTKRDEIKQAVKSGYSDFEAWAKAITPLHNQFRTQLRDALVAYYLQYVKINNIPFEDAAALYAYYLMDHQMDACMKTSRIKLAISSIQLLVHRGLMGFEVDFCPDDQDRKQWEWRKNYRVWEANRKVFLYPENWIEPELRLDKTPFFEELEDNLLQDEINLENSEKALSTYLTNFKEISRLDIRAQYFDHDTNILYVFARTWSEPYVYYYRTREADKKWTPWAKIEVDISGNHLIPMIFNGRLYLFFPMFIDKQHDSIKRTIDGEEVNAPYLEVKMCYTKLEYGNWTAKKVLAGTLLAGDYAGHGVYNNLDNKLGLNIPPTTVRVVPNPDYDKMEWLGLGGGILHPKLGRGEYPDQFSPHGPKKREYIPGDTYRGNMVFDNEIFKDYTKVSLDKDAFYFWASIDANTGDVTIHVRRDFHEDLKNWHVGENEIGYEDCFLIKACDERVSIIPAVIAEPGLYDNRFLAQPYLTQPYAQQLAKANGYEEGIGDGLFVKKNRTHRGDFFEIFKKTQGNYVLTYPHQYKDALWTSPFFYSDDRHTYFIERGMEKKCFSYIRPNDDETGERRWLIDCIKTEVQSAKFDVQNHEHPFACELTAAFNRYGIDGLYDSDNVKIKRQQYITNNFYSDYQPVFNYVKYPFPLGEYDFSRRGSHSDYNWELFFHIPSLMARLLRLGGKFAEGIKWLQSVFDPTNRENIAFRQWKIKPFMKDVSKDSIDNLLRLLSATNLNAQEEEKRKEFLLQIQDWENKPFEPHRIASFRFRAYMLWTVMEYIQILTDWGDMLFKQDTMESINEATQLYVLAGQLLGKRPESTTQKTNPISKTYNDIQSGLDAFSNVAIALEDQITPAMSDACGCCSTQSGLGASLPDLLFCVPNNPKIAALWDTVEDRLFKIRHCMNFDGQVRQLPLFQPPIDPALLVRATAMGLDIGSVLNDINAPEPHYRYSYLLPKANEFTGEVKALGGALLSALEKKDNEELTQLRQRHEQNILKASTNLKKMSLEEAKLGLEIAKHSKKLIEIRLAEYEGKEYMNKNEKAAMKFTQISEGLMYAEQASMLMSQIFAPIPQIHASPTCPAAETGGRTFSETAQMVGTAFGIGASILRNSASLASTFGSFDRRQDDWNLQIKTAKEELKQVEKQILSAEVRVAIAEKDLQNHELQIKQSQEVYDYVKNKFTNLKLYTWMSSQLMKLHRSAYELAYEMAKQAERAMRKELSVSNTISYIQFGNWDSGNRGLLAGEALSVQLKELDSAYVKNDKRRFEIFKDISLKLLDPQALVNLIQKKYCKVELEERLLKLIFKERRITGIQIKSVGLSIPCITGPQISTNVKLRLENGEEIITSTGVNDFGVFEPNFNQARYMPFEYLRIAEGESRTFEIMLEGADDNPPEYDITTIADVVLHVRYYAENAAESEAFSGVDHNTPSNETHLLMSWKHDFPLEWQQYQDQATSAPPAVLDARYIPYRYRGGTYQYQGDLYYLVSENNELVVLSSDNFDPDNPGARVLKDIWLLYQKVG